MQNDPQTQIRQVAKEDSQYTKLISDVRDRVVRKYWLEDGLLCAKGARLLVPKGGRLWQDFLKEHHNIPWEGHLGLARMMALFSRYFYQPDMGNDIEAYEKTCFACQHDKSERKQEIGLL